MQRPVSPTTGVEDGVVGLRSTPACGRIARRSMSGVVRPNVTSLLTQPPFEQPLHIVPVVRGEPTTFDKQIGQNTVNAGSPR